MNQRTSKLISKYVAQAFSYLTDQKRKRKRRDARRWWNSLSCDERTTERKRMIRHLNV